MARSTRLGGIGGIAFAVLTFAAFFVASPAGGTYKASDVANYVARGHRVAVIVGTYLFTLGVFGLICLLAQLREQVARGGALADRIFFGAGIAAATSFAVGWAIVVGPALSRWYGGSSSAVGSNVSYTIAETGNIVLFGAGAILLGLSLLALVAGGGAFPAWLRVATLIAALGALAAPAFFPFFLVLIWGLAVGIWLLASDRDAAAAPRGGAVST